MPRYELSQVVELTEDIPEASLKRGTRGAVVLIFSDPAEAYEVEFVNEAGDTVAELALSPDQIRAVDLKQAAR
jgi:hypothetical protein